jgi:hypothetical protein
VPVRLLARILPRAEAQTVQRACRAVDPFLKKEWYSIKAPSMFQVRDVGKTLITRTQGTKVCLLAMTDLAQTCRKRASTELDCNLLVHVRLSGGTRRLERAAFTRRRALRPCRRQPRLQQLALAQSV